MRSSNDRAAVPYENAGDPASVKQKTTAAKAREEQRLNGLRQIMDSRDGRLWMWHFLSRCGMFTIDFNGNSRDYFNLGQRNAAMPIFSDIQQHCMDEYLLMVKESKDA
jgi:hypothetical protein